MIDSSELEKAIIGCILMDGELFLKANAELDKKDFSSDLCAGLFEAMLSLELRGRSIDPILLLNEINSYYPEIDDKCIGAMIYDLAANAPNSKLFEEYVDELNETRETEYQRKMEEL